MARRSWPGLVAAAGAGALAAWLLHPAAGNSGAVETESEMSALRTRVAALEHENAELRRRAEANRARRHAEAEAAFAAEVAKPSPTESASTGAAATIRTFERVFGDEKSGLAGAATTKRPVMRPSIDVSGDPKSLLEAFAAARSDLSTAALLRAALIGKGAAAVGPLIAVVRDPQSSADLAVLAFEALAELDSKGLPDVVEEVMRRGDAPAPLRAAALGSVVAADPAGALPVVQRLLGSGVAADVDVAREALGRARDRVFLPLLAEEARRAVGTNRMHELVNTMAALKDRLWSAVQMTGEPDTPAAGDLGTAWASKGSQMGLVWVEVDYDDAVVPDLVRIRETLGAGAVVKVEARIHGGALEVLWEGVAGAAETPRWFEPPLGRVREAVRTIRITLDTDKIAGWNEIDAVELVGGGKRQWATAARASSSYAD